MRVVLVGTGHVFDLKGPLEAIVFQERPSVVALELDARRHQGLLARRAGTVDLEAARREAGWLYRKLAAFQDDLAEHFGVDAGAEMLVAADAARALGAHVALIDRDAQATVRDAVKQMTVREKLRFVWLAMQGTVRPHPKLEVEKEIARYQKDPAAYLAELGRDFPTIKRVLIDERNAHMARAIRNLASKHASVVAVVGDGHVEGLAELLRDLRPATHRLSELRSAVGRPQAGLDWRVGSDANRIGFSFTARSPEGTLRRED